MINITILRCDKAIYNDNSHELSIDDILNVQWERMNTHKYLFAYEKDKEHYILYLHEIYKDYLLYFEPNDEDFDEYALTEEQFEFLKIKLL